jgi:hypothetical protein
MSAGSAASNLGYGNIAPLSNINGRYVNVDNSHSPATFGSNQISGTPPGPLPGLAGTKNNVDAAASIYPGSSILVGGAKNIKKKINNITKKYKMSVGSRKRKNLKKRIRSKYASKSITRSSKRKTRRTRKHSRRQRGGYTPPGPPGIPYPPGYSQYQNNLPLTPTYSVGSVLPASQLGLANPPPIQVLPNCTNCTDNYNHYTGTGFPSRGH